MIATDATTIVAALTKDFDRSVVRMKPGSNKRPAMPYVSHGSVTKRLNDSCPGWSSRVVEVHSYVNQAGVLVCAAVTLELTIPNVGSRQEVGTANQPRTFGDDLKNAMSDALKRCAMRFGVAIDLWEGMDEADEDAHPQDTAPQPRAPQRPPQGQPPAFVQPRPAPTAPPAPATSLDDWTGFWSRARAANIANRAALDQALGEASQPLTIGTIVAMLADRGIDL